MKAIARLVRDILVTGVLMALIMTMRAKGFWRRPVERVTFVSEEAPESATGFMPQDGAVEAPPVFSPSPSADMLESMTTATAQITRSDGSEHHMRAIDGEFDRLHVSPNEKLIVRLTLKNGSAQTPILLEADNGGILNQSFGRVLLESSTTDGVHEFEYIIGGNSGKYTVYASQGHRQEVFHFRAGADPPVGQGGPVRAFTPQGMQPKESGK